MRPRTFCLLFAALQLGAQASAASVLDPDPLDVKVRQDPSQPPLSPAQQRARDQALARTPKGPLPDPVLLDGSNQPEEKKQEYGMLGEFEMPGSDEKSDKVGGPTDEKQQAGGGSKKDDKSEQKAGGSQQAAADKNSSAGAQAQAESDSQSGASGASGASGGSAGSKSSKASKSGGSSGSIAQNDPNAKAEGAESSNLSGPDDGGAAAAQGDAAPPKPGEMKVGDAKMQIKTVQGGPAASVVGLQQPVGKDVPQQYDARTPGGGKQSGAGNGNKGVEKGQTMPTGL